MPSSPASPGRTTNYASPEKMASSALTTSTGMVGAAISIGPLLQRLRFLEGLFDRPYHVERLLRQRVALSVHDHVEALDRVFQRDVLAFLAGEVARHRERLRQEALDLAGARDGELVLRRQLVHAENCDDVAQLLIPLQRRLHRAGGVVVILADDVRVDLPRSRVQGVHRRVYAQRCDISGEYEGR